MIILFGVSKINSAAERTKERQQRKERIKNDSSSSSSNNSSSHSTQEFEKTILIPQPRPRPDLGRPLHSVRHCKTIQQPRSLLYRVPRTPQQPVRDTRLDVTPPCPFVSQPYSTPTLPTIKYEYPEDGPTNSAILTSLGTGREQEILAENYSLYSSHR